MSSGVADRDARILRPPQKLQRWLDAALSDGEIGQLLKDYRKRLRVTQDELAEALPMSRSGLVAREQGRRRVTPVQVQEHLNAIERAYLAKQTGLPT